MTLDELLIALKGMNGRAKAGEFNLEDGTVTVDLTRGTYEAQGGRGDDALLRGAARLAGEPVGTTEPDTVLVRQAKADAAAGQPLKTDATGWWTPEPEPAAPSKPPDDDAPNATDDVLLAGAKAMRRARSAWEV